MDFPPEGHRFNSYRGGSIPPNLPSSGSRSAEFSRPHRPISTSVIYPDPRNAQPISDPDPDIYEPIYDSRWRLLNQEASRIHRGVGMAAAASKSPTPASSLSSRESSVGPNGGSLVAAADGQSNVFPVINDQSAKCLRIRRRGPDFGFTLRHFIVYPPEDDDSCTGDDGMIIKHPMESIFVRMVKQGGPAHIAGLQKGDRILKVNGENVDKRPYSDVVHIIQSTSDILELVVVPRQNDILQIYFSEIAQNPETNQRKASSESWSRLRDTSNFIWGQPTNPQFYEPICHPTPPAGGQPFGRGAVQQQTKRSLDNFDRRPYGDDSGGGFYSASQSSDSLHDQAAYAVPAQIIEASGSSTSLESGSTGWTHQYGSSRFPPFSPEEEPTPPEASSFSHDIRNRHSGMHSQIIAPQFRPNQPVSQQRPLPPIPNHEPRSLPVTRSAMSAGVYAANAISRPSFAPPPPPPNRRPTTLNIDKAVQRDPATINSKLSLTESVSRTYDLFADHRRYSLAENSSVRLHPTSVPYPSSANSLSSQRSGQQDFRQILDKRQASDKVRRIVAAASLKDRLSPSRKVEPTSSRQSPARNVRMTDFTENVVRQSPFRTSDMENVRQITSAIVERTPERIEEEPVYSSVPEETVPAVITRKMRKSSKERDELNLRRISYMMATKEEWATIAEAVPEVDAVAAAVVVENDDGVVVAIDEEVVTPGHSEAKSVVDGGRLSSHGSVHHKIFSVFGGSRKAADGSSSPTTSSRKNKENQELLAAPSSQVVLKEGSVEMIIAEQDGKKNEDTNWRTAYAILKSDHIVILREKPVTNSESGNDIIITIKASEMTDVSTKHKNVFRIRSEPSGELLLRAETCAASQQWVQYLNELVSNLETKKYRIRKLGSRTRSPASQSPASKSRKWTPDSQPLEEVTDKDGKKTWKVRVPQQWKKKKLHSSSSSGAASLYVTMNNPIAYPEGGSIGVPIEECPRSKDPNHKLVPLIVTTCCSIVEERGLEIVGVYRVPGNSAAVNYLTEQVNQGEDNFNLEDPRWSDVNVVSSLLKSFFRKLPNPLFTLEMYSAFVQVSKIEDSLSRLNTLKRLVHRLPEVNLATLRFVCNHLVKVIDKADVNKMELRNLAIVFGPTLVRTSDDNMLSMVTDMGQQCRIIESILSNCDWFFSSNDDEAHDQLLPWTGNSGTGLNAVTPEIVKLTADTEITQTGNQSMLLSNLQKLEGSGKVLTSSTSSPMREVVSAKDIVSGIISAANQKMLRGKHKKESMESPSSASASKTLLSSLHGGSGHHHHQHHYNHHLDVHSSNQMSMRRYSEAIMHGAAAMADTAAHLIGRPADVDKRLMTSSLIVDKSSSTINNLAMTSSMIVEKLQPAMSKTESAPVLVNSSKSEPPPTFLSSKPDEDDKSVILMIDDDSDEKAETQLIENESQPVSTSEYDSLTTSEEPTSLPGTTNLVDMKWSSPNAAAGQLLSLDNLQNLYDATSTASTAVSESNLHEKPLTTTHHRFLSLNYLTNDSGYQPVFNIPTPDHILHRSRSPRSLLTETQKVEDDQKQQQQLQQDSNILSLTDTFDEKLRLLLDPNFQSPESSTSATSKPSNSNSSKKSSISKIPVAERPSSARHNVNNIDRKLDTRETGSNGISARRNNSLTKKEKQEINLIRKKSTTTVVPSSSASSTITSTSVTSATSTLSAKQIKMAENRRIKRRHTVGGTKDIPSFEKENYVSNNNNNNIIVTGRGCRRNHSFKAATSHQRSSVVVVVKLADASVEKADGDVDNKKASIRVSSPDLLNVSNSGNRRLSLPDQV